MMHSPSNSHWGALKRLLRYLKGTISHGLLLSNTCDMVIKAFSDVDWASCPDDRRSTTGYVVYLGNNPISWSSKKQHTIARSSTELEFGAIAAAVAKVTWIQSMCLELGLFIKPSPTLFCDNIGALYLTTNPVFHSRMRHVEIDFHYVREKVFKKDLQVHFVATKE